MKLSQFTPVKGITVCTEDLVYWPNHSDFYSFMGWASN